MVVLEAKRNVFKGGVYYSAGEQIEVTDDHAKELLKGPSFKELRRDTPQRGTQAKAKAKEVSEE